MSWLYSLQIKWRIFQDSYHSKYYFVCDNHKWKKKIFWSNLHYKKKKILTKYYANVASMLFIKKIQHNKFKWSLICKTSGRMRIFVMHSTVAFITVKIISSQDFWLYFPENHIIFIKSNVVFKQILSKRRTNIFCITLLLKGRHSVYQRKYNT